MPVVSIIVPVYQVEAYIERCMQSIVVQTYRDFEVLLVDDCGMDHSVAIAEKVLQQLPENISYKVIRRKQNGGLSAARNTGIESASGALYYFLDSDDWIAPTFLEKMVASLIAHPVQMVTCNINRVELKDGAVVKSELFKPSPFKGLIRAKDFLFALWKDKETAYIWRNLYKKELFATVRFPENAVFEDALTLPYLLDIADKIYILDEALYYYLDRPGSITNTVNPQIKGLYTAFVAMKQYFHDKYQNKDMDTVMAHFAAINLLNVILLLTLRVRRYNEAKGYYHIWQNEFPWTDIPTILQQKDLKRGFWLGLFKFSPRLFMLLYRLNYARK